MIIAFVLVLFASPLFSASLAYIGDHSGHDKSENGENSADNNAEEERCVSYNFGFSERHVIKGDFSQAKWSELEPTLPVPLFKSSSKDWLVNFEKFKNIACAISDNRKTVKLIFCSDRDEDVSNGRYIAENSGHEGCTSEYADDAYLVLENPKEQIVRIYQIESGIDFGGHCVSWTDSNDLTIVDVSSRPFIDTTGLYVRTKLYKSHDIEHTGHNSQEENSTYTTWLFAGDKYRLVTSWVDSEYYYFHEETDVSSDNCEGKGDSCSCNEDGKWCSYTDISESCDYYEHYMSYNNGEFSVMDSIGEADTLLRIGNILNAFGFRFKQE